mmetsp:Transcript_21157/g.23944  ORF Transcript_21157/g.23944 Transcript_21157/m.23944 type:complete len:271 (-) Transcript_21157:910-1722(-)
MALVPTIPKSGAILLPPVRGRKVLPWRESNWKRIELRFSFSASISCFVLNSNFSFSYSAICCRWKFSFCSSKAFFNLTYSDLTFSSCNFITLLSWAMISIFLSHSITSMFLVCSSCFKIETGESSASFLYKRKFSSRSSMTFLSWEIWSCAFLFSLSSLSLSSLACRLTVWDSSSLNSIFRFVSLILWISSASSALILASRLFNSLSFCLVFDSNWAKLSMAVVKACSRCRSRSLQPSHTFARCSCSFSFKYALNFASSAFFQSSSSQTT